MTTLNKFLKRPYSNSRSGKTFKQTPKYFTRVIEKISHNFRDLKHLINVLQAPTGTCKFTFSVVLGEWLGFKNKLVVMPKRSLGSQHAKDLEHWEQTGFIDSNWHSATIQRIHKFIKKVISDRELTDEDNEFLNILLTVDYVVLDELHLFSKGGINSTEEEDEVANIMLPSVLDFLRNKGNLKFVLGTTATAKNVKSLYQWAGIDLKFQEIYKTVVGEDELLSDKLVPNLKVEGIFCGNQIGFASDDDIIDAVNSNPHDFEKSVEQLNKKFYVTGQSVEDTLSQASEHYETSKRTFKEQYSTPQALYQALRMFMRNRIRSSVTTEIIDRRNNFKDLNFVSLTFVPRQEDAEYCNEFYNTNSKQIKSVSWHGESNMYKEFKGNTEKFKDWIEDPSNPVKHIALVAMLGEGDDMDFVKYVSDCCFNPFNLDRPVQRRGRIRRDSEWEELYGNSGKWRILWDPYNQRQLKKDTDVFDFAEKMFEEYNGSGLSIDMLNQMLKEFAVSQSELKNHIDGDNTSKDIEIPEVNYEPGDDGVDWEGIDDDDDLDDWNNNTTSFTNNWVAEVSGDANIISIDHKKYLLRRENFTEQRAFELLRQLGKTINKERELQDV